MAGIDYDCAGCGRRHEGADGTEANPWPVVDFPRPEALLRMGAWERLLRTRSSEELCLIDNGSSVDCYLRALLTLPVRAEEGVTLVHAPWVAVAETDYLELVEHWEDPRYRGSFRGTLASALPGYADPLSVPVHVSAPGGLPPVVTPDPSCDHPLARDGREGISRQEAELRIRTMLLEEPPL